MPQLSEEEYAEFARILADLEPVVDQIYSNGQSFVRDQIERNKQYGERTLVSVKQMSWLKSLHEEHVGTAAAQKDEPRELNGSDFAGRNDMDDDIPF